MNAGQKKLACRSCKPAQWVLCSLRQLSTDSNDDDDDGGGDNNGARWTSSMTAQSNSSTDKIGSIRTGSNRIGTPDIRSLLRLRQRQS